MMGVLWNELHLQRPPYRTWETSKREFDAKKFVSTINKVIKDFEPLGILSTEAAILSRLIYRMKCKFRSDKGMKNMEKMNRALLNYLSMSMEKEFKNLKEYVEIQDGNVTLPAKQLLEFVLIRTQGFTKLMCRVESVAMNAAHYWKSRIGDGHAWMMSTIAYAVISRIWALSRHVIKKACNWYSSLYEYVGLLKIVGEPWLPEDYALTKNLKEWLDLPWIEETSTTSMEEPLQKSIFNLIKIEAGENVELEEIVDDLKKQTIPVDLAKLESHKIDKFLGETNNVADKMKQLSHDIIDVGRPVNRRSFELQHRNDSSVPAEEKRKLDDDSLARDVEEAKSEETCESLEPLKPLKKKRKMREIVIVEKKKKKLSTSLELKRSLKEVILKTPSVRTKEDLVNLLNTDSYQGLDKLQWNIVKNNMKKFIQKLENCDENKKQLLLKKAIMKFQKLTN